MAVRRMVVRRMAVRRMAVWRMAVWRMAVRRMAGGGWRCQWVEGCNTMLAVRTQENLPNAESVAWFVDRAARNGVDVLQVSVKMDEDESDSGGLDSGQTFPPSTVAPTARGFEHFDALGAVIEAAHARGIAVHAWVPQFHDRAVAEAHPDWQMMALVDGKVQPWHGADGGAWFVNPLNEGVWLSA